MRFELFGLEIQMKNFDMVSRRPLVEVTQIAPTRKKETCCDQNTTSTSNPNQWTAISRVFVMGSTLPTRSNTMFTVLIKLINY